MISHFIIPKFIVLIILTGCALFAAWKRKKWHLVLNALILASFALVENPFHISPIWGWVSAGIISAGFAIGYTWIYKKQNEGYLYAIVILLLTAFVIYLWK